MAKSVQLIHYSDGTVHTQVVDHGDRPMTSELVVARLMYNERVRSSTSLRDAAAHVGLRPSELSAMEHGRAPFPEGTVNRLRGLYAGV